MVIVGAGGDNLSPDDIPLIGAIRGVTVGATLLIVGFLFGALRLTLNSDRISIALVGAYLCMCFFILPTRVHERYLFPAFAFTSLLAAFDRSWLWANALLAIGSFMNIHGVLSDYMRQAGSEKMLYLPFDKFLVSPAGVMISTVLQTGVFLFVTSRLWVSRRSEYNWALKRR
jgi:hypothetical protein